MLNRGQGTDYTTDPDREDYGDLTGLVALALKNGELQPVDIGELDSESLTRYLRSRGGKNPFAEGVVHTLLGHGPGAWIGEIGRDQ